MVKTLDKLTKGAKRVTATLLAIASLGTASCQQAGVNPKEYYNPTANLTVSPTSGTAPLESRLFLNGSDADGDISKSYVFADYDGDGSMDSGEQLALANSGSIDQNYIFTQSGTFKVYGQCEDDQGNIGKSSPVTMTIQPQIIDPDAKYIISGYLRDNETDTINRTGEVKLFIEGIERAVDSYGNDFYFEVPANSEVKLKGTMIESGVRKSYTRTLNLGNVNENKTEINLRCVPYDALGTGSLDVDGKEADFKEHMRRVNFDATISQLGLGNTLKKWNYGEVIQQEGRPIFQGIEINSNQFGFNHWEKIKESVRDSGHINAESIANNKVLYGTSHQYEAGWITIRHISESPSGMNAAQIYDGQGPEGADGYIGKVVVYLNPDSIDNFFDEGFKSLIIHEVMGHGLLFPGHADNEVDNNQKFPTNMTYTSIGRTQTFSPIDTKASYIVDEPTYLGMESIEDILGSN